MKIPSKKELDEQTQFVLLPHEDYKLGITKVKEDTQDKYNKPLDEDNLVIQEEVINVELEVLCYKDGGESKDEEDNPSKGRKVFFTGRPNSMGFMKDGTPAKTRCLVAYSTGQDVSEEMELEKWSQLIGKTIYAEIIQKENQKGQTVNRIARFVLPPRKDKEDDESQIEDNTPLEEESLQKDEVEE